MIITTSAGHEIIIDDADFAQVAEYSWRVIAGGYAITNPRGHKRGEKRKIVYMHRLLMGVEAGDVMQVDHINGDKLDNRRSNLRLCSAGQNNFNCKRRSHNQSGFKGVIPASRPNRWDAYIRKDRKSIYLGRFSSPESAHDAYCRAAAKIAKDFMNPG